MNAPQTLTLVAEAAHQTVDGASELERLLQQDYSPRYMLEGNHLDKLMRIAEFMAAGRMTVPEYLRGNVGDCFAIAMQAMLWNMDPFAVAQKTHIVSGRLGYEAQLVNAVLQRSGAVRDEPTYEYRGDANSLECRVAFTPRGKADLKFGEWLKISDITTKNSPLWKVNPKQQIGYLQVKNWARAFAPGAILGVYTVDELEDQPPMSGSGAQRDEPAAKPELPAYAMADFETNFPAWQKIVASGKKTAPDLLAMLSTKAVFSEQQKAAILSLKAKAKPTEAPPPATHADPDTGEVDPDFVAALDAGEPQQ